MKSSILTASQGAKSNSIPARQAMSKNLRPIQLIPAAFVLILQFFTFAAGQPIKVARVRVDSKATPSTCVEGSFTAKRADRVMSFVVSYAGADGLAGRISDLNLWEVYERVNVNATEVTPGTFLAERAFQYWTYCLDLKPRSEPSVAAHVSWVGSSGGIIMGNDLLPVTENRKAGGVFIVEVPDDWTVVTSELSLDKVSYSVQKFDDAVFMVGPNLRTRRSTFGTTSFRIAYGDAWQFSEDEGLNTAVSIYESYSEALGKNPLKDVLVVMRKFPFETPSGSWEADTRGSTVTIVSSDMPFKNQSLQRLHEQLRHEIFHLWIPNGVNLTGNYDWFYEGFALYQSLKMGVAVNRIRFDDYLDTISRAYQIDSAAKVRKSMIEESANRWAGSNTTVYARGMLVAFLCDLAMLDASKGKRSTTDLLREIYSKHGGEARSEDGNAAIIAIMKRYPELIPITERYVTGAEKLDWGLLIKSAGIDADARDGRLSVSAKLSGRQKDLLDKLGYNSWRKLANEKR